MQLTGGGASGPIGRRAQGSLERLLRERELQRPDQAAQPLSAGANDAQTQIHRFRSGEIDRDALQDYFAQKNDRSLLDTLAMPGNAMIDFGQNLYHGADEFVRNIIPNIGHAADAAFSGELGTPMDIAKATGQDYLDYYSDPSNLYEDPFRAVLDVAGAYGGAANLPSHAALLDDVAMTGRLAVTPSLDEVAMADDLRAITPFGRKLEGLAATGDEVSGVRNATIGWGDDTPGMVPSAEEITNASGARHYRPRGSAAAPNFGMADVGDETGLAILKPAGTETKYGIDQVDPELFYQELNRRLGEPVRMPGSARASFDYAPVNVKSRPGAGGRIYESSVPPDLDPTNGLAVEFIPGAREATGLHDVKYADQLQKTTLMDYITGNSDRDFTTGHNIMMDDEGPFAIDQGLAGNSTVEDYYADPGPGVVPDGWQNAVNEPPEAGLWIGAQPTPQQWPGYTLSPEHQGLLQQAIDELRAAQTNPDDMLFQYAPSGLDTIDAAILRAENALARGKLFADHPYVAAGSPPLNQPFHPAGMQNLAQRLGAFDDIEQPANAGALEFNPDFADSSEAMQFGSDFDSQLPVSTPTPAGGAMAELQGLIALLKEKGIV